MSLVVDGAPGALGERDLRRLAETVAFVRETGTGEALAAVLGREAPEPVLRHLEFAHAAVLVAVPRPADVVGVLAGMGVVAGEIGR
ncbi:MAG: methyltransferase, partial [Saccharothrix sp.]|nr:methyltransferase [Saccharothrix sp.]